MKKTLKTILGPWGLITSLVLLLFVSKRARSATRRTIVKGYEPAMKFTEPSPKPTSGQGVNAEQEHYPSYIGYGKSPEFKMKEKTRKINPTRYKNTKNVLNDNKMPLKMVEIAEEFDLNGDK